MAMFPLGSVLLPGGIPAVARVRAALSRHGPRLPPCRRRTRVRSSIDLPRLGDRRGRRPDVMVGTVAQMLQVEALDENRYAFVAVGTRRIRINAWLPDDPYPMADVDEWPDEDPDAPGSAIDVAASHARVRAARALAAQVEARSTTNRRNPAETSGGTSDDEISDDPLWPPTTWPRWLRSGPPTVSGCCSAGPRAATRPARRDPR